MAKKHLLYIHDERFDLVEKKSALVNELLDKHWGSANTVTVPYIKAVPAKELKGSTPVPIPESLGGPPDPNVGEKKFDLNRMNKEMADHQLNEMLEKVVENKKFDFCKHGAVKGMCKLGCK